eukprot:725168-Hanusia_phi.AAC.1
MKRHEDERADKRHADYSYPLDTRHAQRISCCRHACANSIACCMPGDLSRWSGPLDEAEGSSDWNGADAARVGE